MKYFDISRFAKHRRVVTEGVSASMSHLCQVARGKRGGSGSSMAKFSDTRDVVRYKSGGWK